MDDDTIRKLTGAAAIDQALAGLAHLGATYGGLYVSLLASGIPAVLAADMIRDQHRMQVYKALWPDALAPLWGDE